MIWLTSEKYGTCQDFEDYLARVEAGIARTHTRSCQPIFKKDIVKEVFQDQQTKIDILEAEVQKLKHRLKRQ